MKFLFDIFPVLLFFAVFKIAERFQSGSYELVNKLVGGVMSDGGLRPDQGPIMLATLVAIIASVLQFAYVKLRKQKIDFMLWLSFIVIVVLGSLTIYLHDDNFIKWKPTIIYWLQASAFLIGLFVFRKNLLKEVMGAQLKLPEEVWTRMLFIWAGAFTFIGAVNLLVAFVIFKDNTSAWVSFKLFGLTGLTLVFIVAQTIYLSKYFVDDEPAAPDAPEKSETKGAA